ncbi:MAG: hypothetical protein ACJA2E_002382 [Arenicella sp.]|jgi:hypothetical protein
MKKFNKITFSRSQSPLPQRQSGAALLITIFVLMALTVVAISVTSSNQSQAIMVRNNQFRLESFNSSYAEIDAQVDFINKRKISDGVPTYILRLIDGVIDDDVNNQEEITSLDYMPKRSAVDTNYIESNVSQLYRGNCFVFGQQLGAGEEKVVCNELKIKSEAMIKNTSVLSNQNQVYEYKTLKQ